MRYGYILAGENEAADRIHAMQALNIPEENIYVDVRSPDSKAKPSYLDMLKKLKPQDVVYLKSFDDLGRNHEEILREWQRITKESLADVALLDLPLIDTRWRKEIIGSYVTDLVSTLFGYMTDRRKYARETQRKGIAEAKRKGVKFGPDEKPLPINFPALYEDYLNGKISLRQAGKECHVSHSTFRKWVLEYKQKEEGISATATGMRHTARATAEGKGHGR